MKSNPENTKPQRERQDWGIVLIIIVFGFLCVIVSAQWALRFSPSWQVDADMGSNLDLNSEFLRSRPVGFIEPIDPAILTQPIWAGGLFTPGAKFITRTPLPPPTATVPTEPGTTPVGTNTIVVTNTSTTAPTNTFVWLPLPATSTRKPKDPPADTPTDTVPPPAPSADLAITNSDGAALYLPGSLRSYTIVVSNPLGPSNVTGATVTNTLSGPVDSASWSCSAVGTVCGAGGPGNINDVVDLPVGSSITYTVNVIVTNPAGGNLVNTATVTLPTGYSGTSPVSLADTDTLLAAGSLPGPLAAPPDCTTDPAPGCDWFQVSEGSPLIVQLDAAEEIEINVGGDGGASDLIYYELAYDNAGDLVIRMDQVIIEIGDGLNWYQVFYWGDGSVDPNTNITSLGLPEPDHQFIPAGSLVSGTGIAIDVDHPALNSGLGIPAGTYSYIRITSPAGDVDHNCRPDAIQVLP